MNRVIRLLLATAACSALVLASTPTSRAQTLTPGILDPTNTYQGKTYGDWSAADWQWVYSLPTELLLDFNSGGIVMIEVP